MSEKYDDDMEELPIDMSKVPEELKATWLKDDKSESLIFHKSDQTYISCNFENSFVLVSVVSNFEFLDFSLFNDEPYDLLTYIDQLKEILLEQNIDEFAIKIDPYVDALEMVDNKGVMLEAQVTLGSKPSVKWVEV